jgi:hypothetical protein
LSEAAEESIYNRACVKQSFQRAKRCGLFRSDGTNRLHGRRHVGPVGGNERFTAVGQDQKKIESTVPMEGLKNSEGFTLERMTSTDNRDSLGKVLMMGSVSYVPSIESITTN